MFHIDFAGRGAAPENTPCERLAAHSVVLSCGSVYSGRETVRLGLTNGIRPRGIDVSSWKDAPGRNDMAYLTRGYPFYYAVNGTKDPLAVVFEIDGDPIDKRVMYPDEDYICHVADGV